LGFDRMIHKYFVLYYLNYVLIIKLLLSAMKMFANIMVVFVLFTFFKDNCLVNSLIDIPLQVNRSGSDIAYNMPITIN
jgi:hypothetical protein